MLQNCQVVALVNVINFFVEDIDGTGKDDGYPRNSGTTASLQMCKEWRFCELTEKEFMYLIIPDGSNMLLKDKNLADVEGNDSKFVVRKYLKRLKHKNDIPALIVRSILSGEPKDGSFYIEDGAHRAIAAKVYFESNPYKAVKAYIGTRKV